jgi:hypothetical protein
MIEVKQTLNVENHKVMVNLPKDFNYKKVNVSITPFEVNGRFSFEKSDFEPIVLKNSNPNLSTSILREDRDFII